ncbi:MAG: FKBP-type peptidyl-prolyl cis-trans isomerase [Candidatus Latescibacteria bacterium]|jgi:FKBP-type peptidyl-prolyl cis-trans isomerase|nr:FKBP-type peptidyl-prolyl cis-trans isomerase [Candidatus Latescibacterota bacterium]
MKRLFMVFVAAGLLSCQGEEKAEFVEVDLENKQHKQSYALGLNLSDQLKQQGVDLDIDVFKQGFGDGFAGESMLMTSEEAVKILVDMQQEQRAQQQAEQNKVAEENKRKGAEFLAQNRNKEGVVVRESGLQYKVIRAGDGPKPKTTDTVSFHYRGTLVDGTQFDSSYDRGEPLTLKVTEVVPGWVEALPLMNVGSKWELYIPPELGYGARPAGQIGPHSTLIFELELLEIK